MGTFVSGYSGKILSLNFLSYQFKTSYTSLSKKVDLDNLQLDDSDFLPDEDKYDDSSINLNFEECILAHNYLSEAPKIKI